MQYQNIRLDKSLYKNEGGFSAALEQADPSRQYENTELAGLDAFQRQLKRFDIRVAGPDSSPVSKFFSSADSSALFPEYVARAVAQGAREAGILEDIIASKTDVASPFYRSITTDIDATGIDDPVDEGDDIPETTIELGGGMVELKKRGRLLNASYEAIRYQRTDVFSVALRQIGAHIARAQLRDAVAALLGPGDAPAQTIEIDDALTYIDLLDLWSEFEDFEMNVLLASPDMAVELLKIEELRDPHGGLNFQNTGAVATPLGARLHRTSAVRPGTIIALDRRFALEMVTSGGGLQIEYDRLIDTQLERAAVTSTCGFNRIFPGAVRALVRV